MSLGLGFRVLGLGFWGFRVEGFRFQWVLAFVAGPRAQLFSDLSVGHLQP